MKFVKRNQFRLTRFILLKLPFLFQFLARYKSSDKRLLIIKTDAIGDYVLFRNFLEIVKRSEKYKDYQIDLLGNVQWQDLALKYDSSFVSEFYFTRPYDLYESPSETFKLGWKLFKNNYEVVFQPSFTRILITDGLAALTAAKQIIGFCGDNESIMMRYKIKTDKFYTQKLELPPNIYFEFERSRFFFQSVLNSNIDIVSPSIIVNKTSNKGIVISPTAGAIKRSWEKEKFLSLLKLIIEHTSQHIYLTGGSDEIEIGDYLTEILPGKRISNLIGQTTLSQLVQLIGNAALVIANETSAIHLAVATATKSICILGGGHFNRFAPYPSNFEYAPVCIYEKMECYNCNWDCKFEHPPNKPFPCVSNVNFERVWHGTLKLLQAE